jgi:hypothetical protein
MKSSHRTMTRTLGVWVAAVAIACMASGCGKKDDDDDEEDSGNAPSGGTTQDGGDADLPDAPQHVLDLFQDTSSIDPAALGNGGTDCLQIDSQATFADAVEPWPAELKAFLASELAKFPEFDLVTGAVAGIFLAKADMLSDPSLPELGGIAGIMCGAAGDTRGYVFINHEEYVTNRLASGALGTYQSLTGAVDPHVVTEHGDQAVYTLIHEIFHAIDHTYYRNTDDATALAGRAEVLELAWNDAGDSLDPRADIYALTGTSRRPGCTLRGFSLAPVTPDEHVAAYRQIAEETNFISPYAQSNEGEDFADTLATWYFRVTYDNGLIRSVYREDITATPLSSAELLYKFDTKEILSTSERHRDKMCAMVDLVFAAQDCASQLQN